MPNKSFDITKLRCIHRHSWPEHKSCFVKGLVKYPFKDDKEFEKLTGIPWYLYPGNRIGYLDIESDGLKADFGTMLTWCIKEKGGAIAYDKVTKEELFDGAFDYRIVKSLIDELYKYKIVVTYYGTGFDLPFVRSKALHYNLEFPSYGELYHHDLYYTVKAKLCLSRNSLDNACDYLGIDGKTKIDKEMWRRAKYGDPEALLYVLSHNKGDVEILEELHDRLEFTRKWIKTSI